MRSEHLPSQAIMTGVLREAVSDALHDQKFIHSLAEELADMLGGADDKIMLKALEQANDGEFVSEEEIFAALKAV